MTSIQINDWNNIAYSFVNMPNLLSLNLSSIM